MTFKIKLIDAPGYTHSENIEVWYKRMKEYIIQQVRLKNWLDYKWFSLLPIKRKRSANNERKKLLSNQLKIKE